MQTTKHFKTTLFSAMLLAASLTAGRAQTATWVGATGGEWNTPANWDIGVPGSDANATTNAVIGSGITANYNLPMTAASFGSLTDNGVVNVNTNGFNSSGILLLRPGGGDKLFVNNGGIVNVTGNLGISSNAIVSMSVGSSVTLSGSLIIGTDTTGGSGGTSTTGGVGSMTNNGGNLTAISTLLNPKNASIGTSCLLMIKGGTNNLGAFSSKRSPGGNSAPPALGTDGLVISNGFVNTTSISIGNNAHGVMFLAGGTVTNTGSLTLVNSTATRPARFVQAGGLFVTTDPSTVIMSGSADTVYAVTGGTNIVGGFQFNATTVFFTNAATIYVGSAGITAGAGAVTASLNSGGIFGATADWTGSAPMKLIGGTFTFSPVDLSGAGHTITLSGVLSGAGSLLVTNAGTLALASTNTYTGGTTISTGSTLQLGDGVIHNGVVAGSITNNGTLTVANPNSQSIIATNIVGSGPLIENGPGTLALLGTNTSIGGITINAGTLQLGDGATTDGAVPGIITDNATFGVANPTDQTLVNVVNGGGSFVKGGAGTLTIGANENYAGSTTVNAGNLVVGAGGSIGSTQNVTIASGALFDVSTSTSGSYTLGSGYNFNAGHTSGSGPDFRGNLTNNGTINIPAGGTFTLNGNLSMMDGGSAVFNLGSTPGTGSTITLTGGTALHLNGTTTIQVNFTLLGIGTYPLISGASSVSGGIGNLNLVLNGSIGANTANLQVTGTGVNLVVTGNQHNLVWLGDGAGNSWDNNSGNTDWSNTVTHLADFFVTGFIVTFDDNGAANQPILNDVVTPAFTTVNGSSSYTFSGGGYINSGSLTNNSSGTLFIQTANTYSGGTTINAGTVEVDNNGALGTGPVVDNTALVFNRGDIGNTPGVISGNGTVTMENGGIETLSAANIYAGGTTIASGTLQLGAANAIPGGTVAGDVTNNGELDMAGFSDVINGLAGSGTVDTVAGGTPTLTVGGNGDGGTFNGVIQNSSGTLNILKKGAGTQIFGNANTYGGITTIANGTLALAVDDALPPTTTVTLGGTGTSGTFDMGGFSQFVAGLAVGSGATAASQVIGNSGGTPSTLFYNTGGSSTFGGTIQDVLGAGTSTVELLINGGSLTLNGTNTYSGGTTINSGSNSFLRVSGGLLAGTTLTMNSANASKGFLLSGGVASFSGLVSFSDDNGNNADFMQVTGGVLNASTLLAGRTSLTLSGAPPTAGQSTNFGIYVTGNATLNITNTLDLGISASSDSSVSMRMDGGTVNVGGTTTITLANAARWSVLDINGGTFTSADTAGTGIQIGGDNAGASAELLVRAGTVSANTITLGDTNGIQTSGTNLLNLVGGALYVGAGGIISGNPFPTYTETVNLGTGILGALANWSSSLPITLVGNTSLQAANGSNTPFNIALNGALSGSGILSKTGGGTLTLGATNNYSGSTLINAGTLALGTNAAISSLNILVGSNTTFDVSQVVGGFTLNGNQTLKGFGTVAGAVSAASGSIIFPGSNSVTGTLTFAGGLAENGGVNNTFNLSTNASGPNNDSISVPGALTVSGVNPIQISGLVQSGGAYPLISYAGGTFTGSITNFTVSGASGTLSNSTSAHIIYFVAFGSARNPTNVTWVGNSIANNWDTELSTNWLNTGTGLADIFVPNDSAVFDNLGATNPLVTLVSTLTPASITVNTTSNYTFTGNGSIGGAASLTVSNGTLTILTTNTYTGQTILDGGVLVTPVLANSGSPSGIGSSTSDPTNVILNGGTLSYSGASAGTDHGITLTNAGGSIDVIGGTSLTLGGLLTGNGSLTKVDNGRLILPNANSYTGTTTIGGGVLQLNTPTSISSAAVTFNNGTLAYSTSAGITIANPFNFTAGTTNMIIVTSGSSANPVSSGTWTGSGVILVSNTFLFTVNGNLDPFTGTISMVTPNGSTFRFNSGGGNTSFGSTNATFDLGQGTAILTARNGGTMNLGALQGGSGTVVLGQGSSSTAGPITWSIGNNNLSTTFAGIIKDNAANELSAVTKVGSGTLTLSGANIYSGPTIVSGGALLVNGAIGTGPVTINGGTLGGFGTLGGAVTVQSGGTLAPGAGTNVAGTVMTIANNLTLLSGSTNIMQLSHIASTNGVTNDVIVSSGTITYGGTLVVVANAGDSAFTNGDRFTLFNSTAVSYIGNFVISNLPPLPAGLAWTNTLAIDGSIEVISNGAVTPAPVAAFSGTPTNIFVTQTVAFTDASTGSITNWIWNFGDGTSVTNASNTSVNHTYATAGNYTVSLTVNGAGGSSTSTQASYIVVKPKPVIGNAKLTGGSFILSGTNGPVGQQYRILTSTNVALALANWTPVWTNVVAADGSYGYTNSSLAGSGKFFILVSP